MLSVTKATVNPAINKTLAQILVRHCSSEGSSHSDKKDENKILQEQYLNEIARIEKTLNNTDTAFCSGIFIIGVGALVGSPHRLVGGVVVTSLASIVYQTERKLRIEERLKLANLQNEAMHKSSTAMQENWISFQKINNIETRFIGA